MTDVANYPALMFPRIDARVRTEHGAVQIYDVVRRTWVALTPEEWVRQHVVQWLTEQYGYASGRFAVERSVGPTGERYDIVWHDADLHPWLLVECKAPSVNLTPEVLRQSAWYNLHLNAPYILLTNGRTSFCVRVHESGDIESLSDIPTPP